MENSSGETAESTEADTSFAQETLLQPLADELMAIAERLRSAATASDPPKATPEQPPATRQRLPRSSASHLALARRAYALRRKRAAIFGNPDLFGEPAWDILLDLFIAHAEGKPVSVSSACIGSAAPATTGLRWLGVLADEGLVVREGDASDQRRVLVRLTATGLSAMERFFDEVQGPGY
ncbi:MarR family winged helix-turn-helix transcriptional regulator [Porphyrobacter sp. HT-58-2]|uniref:MarR family winged helix-turn-helix transcriptional regulator n=1 Tax=Porphyrobacter sp. HT-58-2 TaxID=2023229 RepID=UPI0018F88478|nr:MarR family winged helix-turn-helix transcriptional regulator [Porphyrobacter sp. HT-58-2]